MLGQKRLTLHSAARYLALAFAAAACNRDGATTGPTGTQSKDFASNLRLVSGDQQAGALGAALAQPIQVKVVDAGGQPVQGATVTFSVRAGGGSVNPAANISDASGIVSSTWTMGATLGAAKVVAMLTNAFVLDSTVFTATATAGPATQFSKVSGDNQTGFASRALSAALVVKVRDAFGNNLSGVRITWSPNGGSVSFMVDTTGADGTASATWNLGTVAGLYGLNATVAGVTTPLLFSATATPDTGRVLTATALPPASGTASTAIGTVTLRVTDQYFNLISGAGITWNDSIAGGGSLSVITGTTSAAGTASTTWTLGRRLGQQLVRAKLTGRTETATFTANATIAYSEVIAGNAMACGLSASTAAVYCWGAGNDGQLGKGGTANSNAPSVAVAASGDSLTGPILQVRQITGGRNGYCALTPARTLYCWGRQLGGTANNSPTAIALASGGAGVLPNFAAMGEDFGCLLTLAGNAFCGGNNFNGQLGNGLAPTGTAVGSWVAVDVTLGQPTLYSVISSGRAHACGLPRFNSGAPVASQSVWCWGLNNQGQVGDNTTVNKFVPVPVVAPAGIRYDSATVATGAEHSCVLEGTGTIGTAGAAWCWGNNGFGQLGLPLATARFVTPTTVAAAVDGTAAYARLYAGEYHTCALTATGTAYCWGRNDSGQVGNGTAGAPVVAPTPVVGLAFRSLSLGENFTCGVTGVPGTSSTTPGTIYCWGANQFGQLGVGSNATVLSPAAGRIAFQP